MKKNKDFDCVEMMHHGQREARKRLAGLSQEEKLAYYRDRAREIRAEQKRLREERTTMRKDSRPEV